MTLNSGGSILSSFSSSRTHVTPFCLLVLHLVSMVFYPLGTNIIDIMTMLFHIISSSFHVGPVKSKRSTRADTLTLLQSVKSSGLPPDQNATSVVLLLDIIVAGIAMVYPSPPPQLTNSLSFKLLPIYLFQYSPPSPLSGPLSFICLRSASHRPG